eukprot:Rmarinus@m.4591
MTTCGQCILHAVQHIHQSHNWDCGLACSEMALRFWGYENCSLKTLQEACGTKSVWTIDIAYLLQLFGLECELRTMILGVHPDYKNEVRCPFSLCRLQSYMESLLCFSLCWLIRAVELLCEGLGHRCSPGKLIISISRGAWYHGGKRACFGRGNHLSSW